MTERTLCECGCGKPAPIAKVTKKSRGWVRGQPVRFISGHNKRITHPDNKYLIDPMSGCFIWLETLDKDGYGFMKVDGKMVRAHRYFYEREFGEIDDDLPLDHTCRRRYCVNPYHLEQATVAENTRRGTSSKLSVHDVVVIRDALDRDVKQHSLALQFGVSDALITLIKQGKVWANV